MVRRVETRRADVPPGAGETPGKAGAEGVAVVFDQPEAVLVAEGADRVQFKGVAERVGEHYRAGPVRPGLLQTRDVDVGGLRFDVDEDRHRPVLEQRRDRGRKPGCDGDHLVAAGDPPLPELRSGQRHEGEQIGRGAGVHQQGGLYAEVLRQSPFELPGVTPGGEPELQCGIDQIDHFALVEDPSAVVEIGDARFKRRVLRRSVNQLVIFPNLFENFIVKLLLL